MNKTKIVTMLLIKCSTIRLQGLSKGPKRTKENFKDFQAGLEKGRLKFKGFRGFLRRVRTLSICKAHWKKWRGTLLKGVNKIITYLNFILILENNRNWLPKSFRIGKQEKRQQLSGLEKRTSFTLKTFWRINLVNVCFIILFFCFLGNTRNILCTNDQRRRSVWWECHY